MGTQQALVNGVPVLGIASNMDQYLNMGRLEMFGVGKCLRAMPLGLDEVRSSAERILKKVEFKRRATTLSESIRDQQGISSFEELIRK